MTTHWEGNEALGVGQVLLLEASAGTGKTFQIAQLVLRLVAEVGIPIERILTITFTTAATAELRDRIRRRLDVARAALEEGPDAPKDAFLESLSDEGRRVALPRLQNALAAFDLAPISTIHGFSQRMLDLFAFESGQESGLTLLPSVAALLDELVLDELARVYAATTEAGLAILESVGFTRERLQALAFAMTGAVEPALSVACTPNARPLADLLSDWQQAVAEFRRFWRSDAAAQCLDAVRRDAALPPASAKGSGPKRRFSGAALDADKVASAMEAWLGPDALPGGGSAAPSGVKELERARTSALSRWNQEAPVSEFEGYPLFARFDGLCERLDDLLAQIHATAITGFASTIRVRVEARLARSGLLSYDAMLSRLAERIAAQGPGGSLATAIRERYDVALVDEFQDTDAAQWTVLRAVFGSSAYGRRLLLIGDPKQAIYRFRGADIFVYLEAAASATARHTMGKNWRSDGDYVSAMNHLWREGSDVFELGTGDDGLAVDYVTVDAAAAKSRIRGLPREPGDGGTRERRALEVRWMDATTPGDTHEDGPIGRRISSSDDGLGLAARLCADEVATLLGGAVQLDVGTKDASVWTPVEPGHIAVLVRTHKQGQAVKLALGRLAIPVVTAATGRIFESRVLGWVRAWLDAVAGAGRDGPARTLAVTPLVGWTAQQLAAALDGDGLLPGDGDPRAHALSGATSDWTLVTSRIAAWAARWERHGFIRVFESALDECDALPRLLASPGGERLATDLRHLCELLHAEERRTRVGPGGLATWLAAQAATDTGDDTLALRLESDARAVQIVTNHASKGLEYPIVLIPFAWTPGGRRDDGAPFLFHAPAGTGTTLELRLEGDPERAASRALHDAEERQEELRLLYVALTRARHHTVVWYGPVGRDGGKTGASALGRLLLRGESTGTGAAQACPEFVGLKGDALLAHDAVAKACFERLDALAARSDGTIGWSAATLTADAAFRSPAASGSASPIEARRWPTQRSLFSEWQIASFTSLARRAPHLFLESGSEEPRRDADASIDAVRDAMGQDEPKAATLLDPWPMVELDGARISAEEIPLPLETLIGGADTGTWLHTIFEHLDFPSGRARDGRTLDALVTNTRARAGLPVDDAQCATVVAAIPGILATPLEGQGGSTAPALPTGWRLGDLDAENRLDELRFDLRLGAGRGATVLESSLRRALGLRTDEGWGGMPWLSALLGPERSPLAGLAGILTGSIDLVFRTPGPTGSRYVIVDYKTNRISSGTGDGRSRVSRRGDYAGDGLAGEMARHAYHLQGLLYTVALHRFLAGRLGGAYDYDRHVGGLLYLFLRGMEGAETPRTPAGKASAGRAHGVYADRWPKEVVLAVDAALLGEVLP